MKSRRKMSSSKTEMPSKGSKSGGDAKKSASYYKDKMAALRRKKQKTKQNFKKDHPKKYKKYRKSKA